MGTGTIAAAMVEGLCSFDEPPRIVVSPRNAANAAALAARFPSVSVAHDNQAVLDASEMVVLAVRPQIAGEVLPPLRFRRDHHVLSLIATVSLGDLRPMTAPAARLTRAIPLPPVARLQGPTPVFPPDPTVRALFDRLGAAIELSDEAGFDVFTAATATMGGYFAYAQTIAAWMARQGADGAQAHAFVAQLLEGLAGASRAAPGASFAELADEHQTRGGINEQVHDALTYNGIIVPLDRALGAVLDRLRAGRRA